MRSFTNALTLAAAALASVSTGALAQVTNDIDAIESRQRVRESAPERIERAREQSAQQVEVQQAPQQERQVFQPRADQQGAEQQGNVEVRRDRGNFERRANREQNNVEVRRDGGFFNRRNDQQQGNVEVRRDDRRFDRRQGGVVTGAIPPSDAVSSPQNGRDDGRRFQQRDGQRFGRNEEYHSDHDDHRRFDRDGDRRRGEITRDGNWYRDDGGKWLRRDGRYYGNRDNRDYGYNGGNKDFRWNRDWRRDSRYDWQRYRFSNRSVFRQSRYYDPFGSRYGYQRFSIGIRLGSSYYNDRYWISDPFAYRLPYADGPYRWVRYYDDVLLVDLRNGAVVDVIYDFFW
jgi:Nickel/cobalt transporter regulator